MYLISLFLSGILLSIAFAPSPARFLAFLALIPLIHFAPRRPFLTGFVFGIGHHLSLLFWISFLVVPPPTKRWVLIGMVVLIIYLSCYYGFLSLAIKHLGVISLPFSIIILEFIRSQCDTAFPWSVIGYTQTSYLPILQIASIFGIYGLSFFVALVNVLIYKMITEKKFHLIPIPVLVAVLGFLMIKPVGSTNYKVGILQPNIDTNVVWSRGLRDETFDRLIAGTEKLARQGVELIVWPESSMPTFIAYKPKFLNQIKEVADSYNVAVLFGTGVVEREPDFRYYNGAVLIKPEVGVAGIYKKIHLVPFSEHLPFEEKIGILRKIRFGQSNYHPGNELKIFSLGKKFGCLICFESIFPELSREFVRKGADFLVNITNDGWFGKTPGPYQHAEMAVVRSVEFRTPMVRCGNTGVSMLIDPYGRQISRTEIFKEEAFIVKLPEQGKSLYYYLGDVLVYFSVAIVGFLIIRVLRPSLLPSFLR